ncbi:solute carrier family 35 member G1-like [Rhopilema esculentum]|uniref:solute carrier family 35 member G1-like n=1 Tax=Rhopilema esculentum TaxID=499914 RepID=UPI0031D13AED
MSLIAVKDEDPDSDEEEPKKTNPRILGLGLMAGAGCFLTIGNVIVQYTHKKWPSKVSTFEVLFIRSFIQTLFIVAFMTYGKVSVYGNCLRNLIVLSIMGIAEVAAIVCVYFALERIPVGDATVIQFTAPVFTVAFSFLCLRKGCGILDTVCGVISFGGVIVLARPTILFSHKEHNAHGVSHIMHSKNNVVKPGDAKYLEGIGYAIIAAVCLSLFFILNKMTGKKLDVTLTIFYPCQLLVVVLFWQQPV